MDNTMLKCPGCGRDELHKMCPAYGTKYYMSGILFTPEMEAEEKKTPKYAFETRSLEENMRRMENVIPNLAKVKGKTYDEVLAELNDMITQNMEWTFNSSLNTWVTGTEKEGAGVYEMDGQWHGNLVSEKLPTIVMYGPYHSKEKAIEQLEIEFKKLTALRI